ncbi:hypothetical protein [Comamonas sp. B-9]|uniref:hypothetical protein n=1 Tax=Comamonas sp. B-9 TaxID=1055192 RepID=UPI0011DD0B32|nr:hypothetical protein [Comamonas sp. B-9]
MDLNTFESRATRATERIFSFAAFVAAAKDPSTDPRYADAWLDAEIVNALAAWEEQGRPRDWSAQWQQTFRNEVIQAMAALKKAGKARL